MNAALVRVRTLDLNCTHDMLNEGLASWSEMEAMTCWGKPKQMIMHIKDVVEEYILYIMYFPYIIQD